MAKITLRWHLRWALSMLNREQLVWFDPEDSKWVCYHCGARDDESASINHIRCPYAAAKEAAGVK